MAKILLTAQLRDEVGGAGELDIPGDTLGQVLENLFTEHPAMRASLVDRHGWIRRHILLFTDDRQLPREDYERIELSPDAQVKVLIAISGG